jgi:hypothetical protein
MFSHKVKVRAENEVDSKPNDNLFPFIKFLDESPEGQELVKKYNLEKVPKSSKKRYQKKYNLL